MFNVTGHPCNLTFCTELFLARYGSTCPYSNTWEDGTGELWWKSVSTTQPESVSLSIGIRSLQKLSEAMNTNIFTLNS